MFPHYMPTEEIKHELTRERHLLDIEDRLE